jgi:hypothetical protein
MGRPNMRTPLPPNAGFPSEPTNTPTPEGWDNSTTTNRYFSNIFSKLALECQFWGLFLEEVVVIAADPRRRFSAKLLG